jgi:hypothetical protein
MCGCQQGICPGACACGCQHTPPTGGEKALVDRFSRQIKSLNITVESLAKAIYEATGTEVNEYGDGHELALERLAELGERAAAGDEEGIVLHRVIVSLILTDRAGDEAELVSVEFEGEPPLMSALGMLRMAEDTMLHGPGDDE